MATFLLVHGGMHGDWCWEKVVPLLKAAGHDAMAPTLPGSSDDGVSPADVTLEMTGSFIADLAGRQREPVVLVGHSLGGITISEAAERAPEAVRGLVYLAAILLPYGARARGNTRGGDDGLTQRVMLSADGHTISCNPATAGEIFYNGCAEADIAAACRRFTPQPIRPMGDPVTITPTRYGALPRAYIECLQDNAHPLALQRSQQAAMPCDPVFAMDTGHSPFYQAPEALVAHLITAAATFEQRAHS